MDGAPPAPRHQDGVAQDLYLGFHADRLKHERRCQRPPRTSATGANRASLGSGPETIDYFTASPAPFFRRHVLSEAIFLRHLYPAEPRAQAISVRHPPDIPTGEDMKS